MKTFALMAAALCGGLLLAATAEAQVTVYYPPATTVYSAPVVVQRPVVAPAPVVVQRPVIQSAPVVVQRPVIHSAPVVVQRPVAAPAVPVTTYYPSSVITARRGILPWRTVYRVTPTVTPVTSYFAPY